jgi:hypothetical protein
MVIHTDDGQTVLAHFPEAESVYMLGKVNRWGMVALRMRCRDEDGLWETGLPDDVSSAPLAFFVRRRGEIAGCICRQDYTAA